MKERRDLKSTESLDQPPESKSEDDGQQYVSHGAAGRAGLGYNDFCRGPVNVDVIPLIENWHVES